VKAYATRVGNGPFPTELLDKTGERLRDVGREFGSTTGRPRRCGWLDIPALRLTIRLSGIESLALTKLDVLDGLPEIKLCVAYRLQGKVLDEMPLDPTTSPRSSRSMRACQAGQSARLGLPPWPRSRICPQPPKPTLRASPNCSAFPSRSSRGGPRAPKPFG